MSFWTRVGWAAVVVGVIATALAVGGLSARTPLMGLAVAGAVLLVGVSAIEPALIPVGAMPLFVVVLRVSGGGVDLTLSDLALGLCTALVLVFAPRPFSPELRQLLWLDGIYQFATLFTVIANLHRANTVEWFHAWMLVSGALIVGWTIGHRGYGRAAMRIFLVVCAVLAGGTLVQGLLQYAHRNFAPVYTSWPYDMHKNFVGDLLTFAAVVAFARPSWLNLRPWTSRALFWGSVAAMLVAQSRQGLVATAVVVLVLALRGGSGVRRRPVIVLMFVIPALFFVTTLVQDQLASGNPFNSTNQRLSWFRESYDYWLTSPLIGHGLRFWYYGAVIQFQPPNAEFEVLTESGVIGLIAFLVLMLGSLRILWRLSPAVGTLAFALVLARFVQGQMDLFWVSVHVSLPFLLAGICLALVSQEDEQERRDSVVASARGVMMAAR